jgi:hypothetical protein
MPKLKYFLIYFLFVFSYQATCSQELNENEFQKYKTKLEEVQKLQKNRRYAQSYELLKEYIEDLKDIKNYNLEIAQLKSEIYLFASFCFSDDPGGEYFYNYKKYLTDLVIDEILYQGMVEKFGVKTAKSLTKSDKKNHRILEDMMIPIDSKNFDFSTVDTSLTIYNKKLVSEINEQKSDMIINLTVSGRGVSKDSAILSALKFAINQGFSSFITTNTKIINDSLINDEVIQMSNGTINKFTILTDDSISSNDYSVVLKVFMAVNRMNDIVKSKGIESELDGAEFAFNQKLRILNDQNELKTLKTTLDIALSLYKKSIDYKVIVFDPVASVDKPSIWEVPVNIDFQFNQNIKLFTSYLYNNLIKISLGFIDFQNYKKLGLRNNIKLLAIGPVPMLSYNEEVLSRQNKALETPNPDDLNDLYTTLVFHNNKKMLKEFDGKKEKFNEREVFDFLTTCKLFNYTPSIDSIYYFVRPSYIFDYYTPFIYFRNPESIKHVNNFVIQLCTELFTYTVNNGVSNYSIRNIIDNSTKYDKLTKINSTYSKFYPALDRDLSSTIVEPSTIFNDLDQLFNKKFIYYSNNSFNVPLSNELFNFIYDKNGDYDNMVQTGRINENINMFINLNSFKYTGKSIYRVKYMENLTLEDIQKIKKYKLVPN